MLRTTPTWDTIAIIGVGLIGGSIGLAIRERRLARRIVGVGRRKGSLDKARRYGAIDRGTTDIARGVTDAEFIIICTPVERIVEHVHAATEACPPAALITDAGSTKQAIVEAIENWPLPGGVRFVGSHPLAGSEKTGCENGDGRLFEDRVCVVTPSRRTRQKDYEQVARFWEALGMHTLRMTPKAHDAALATTSHLPHVVASALAAATREKHLPLVAGGWRDTTRIAAADAQLWRQILLENADNALRSIAEFETALAALRDAIAQRDGQRLERLLRKGKQRRDAAGE